MFLPDGQPFIPEIYFGPLLTEFRRTFIDEIVTVPPWAG